MSFKKLIRKIHLWLGLASGIIMLVVCLTGAIWVFNEEVSSLTNDVPKVPIQDKPLLLPSQLSAICRQELGGKKATSIQYTAGKAAYVGSWDSEHSHMLRVNPYTGEVLKTIDYREGDFDFFSFVLNGHRFLWLPWKIGRPIVNYGVLTFVIVLISGLILWWPRSKKAARPRLWFRWKKETGIKRKVFDLHVILGFYASGILLVLALTGMVWGIQWYSKGVYWASSGGKELPSWRTTAQSDTLQINTINAEEAVDRVFQQLVTANPTAESFQISFPADKPEAVISASVYPEADKKYNYDRYSFDRYSLKEITGLSGDKYANASSADKLRRMNYDIHTGSILGLTGKMLAFFAALIGASLPITGFWIWWKKKSKLNAR